MASGETVLERKRCRFKISDAVATLSIIRDNARCLREYIYVYVRHHHVRFKNMNNTPFRAALRKREGQKAGCSLCAIYPNNVYAAPDITARSARHARTTD